jgi:hypothetical protein
MRSNLAKDTSTYENHIDDLARIKRQGIRKSPAYKISRYKTTRSASGENQWTVSFTHNDSLADEASCEYYVPNIHTNLPIIESTGDQSTTQNDLDLSWQRYVEELMLDLTEETWDIETRLIPPPMPTRRIKVKFRITGKEAPRIFFDPERD